MKNSEKRCRFSKKCSNSYKKCEKIMKLYRNSKKLYRNSEKLYEKFLWEKFLSGLGLSSQNNLRNLSRR